MTSILSNEKSSRSLSEFEFVCDSKDRSSRLGKGSFASVRLVQEKRTGKLHALKMINVNSSKLSKSDLHNLRTEIQVHRLLNHPNIIKFNDYIQEGLNIYLLLDYAENGNLYNYLHKKKVLTPNEVFHFFYQTCLAVQYIHDKDVLHRDIKPENLLLDKDCNIKLCDFGWAAKSIKDKRITFCGTYEYMAPEIVRKKPYDYRVDIWSLGVLLYELIHREAPYKGRNLAEIVNSLSKSTLSFSASIQPEVKHLIEQILKIDPNERISIAGIMNHPWIQYHLHKKEFLHQAPVSSFVTPTKPPMNCKSPNTEQDTYVSEDLIPAQEQIEESFVPSRPESQAQPRHIRNLKNALAIQVPTLTVHCTILGESHSHAQPSPRSASQISSVLPKFLKENDYESTPYSAKNENFYSNKAHSHSSSALPKKVPGSDHFVLDARKHSNDSGSRKLFEKDIMSPDFNIKLHSILGQLNGNPPTTTRREGAPGSSVLTNRSNNNQPRSANHVSSASFRAHEVPVARENSLVRQQPDYVNSVSFRSNDMPAARENSLVRQQPDQKENPHNATSDFSNVSLENFRVKYSSENSKQNSRTPSTNYPSNNVLQARADPFQNIHIPTFKINFSSPKYKLDTSKSSIKKYFVVDSTQKSSESMSKGFNNSAFDAMVSSLCKTTRAEEKSPYEGYLIQSSSLTDLQKKLLFKVPETVAASRGIPAPLGERVMYKNKENRMETTRDNRMPYAYDKLYSQR